MFIDFIFFIFIESLTAVMASKRSAAIKLKHTKLKDKTIEGAPKSFFNSERRISMAFFGLIGIIFIK